MTQDIDPAAIAQPETPTQAGGALLAQDSAIDAWPSIVYALYDVNHSMPPAHVERRGGDRGNQYTVRRAGHDDAD
jgi:hypothetical protein